MKSPWKMIGQLISRRRAPEEGQDPPADGDKSSPNVADTLEVAVSPSKPVQTPTELSAVETDAVEAKGTKDGGEVADPAPVAVDLVEVMPSSTPKRAPAGKRLRSREAETASTTVGTRSRRGGRSKSASTAPVMNKTNASTVRPTSPERPSDAFQTEIADVDAEIRDLSRQLAEKLRQQNAQLRRMLERFGDRDGVGRD